MPRDHLTFLLEPVIDLATNETEHYRARYNMATTTGSEIAFERLVANADKSGLAPEPRHACDQPGPAAARANCASSILTCDCSCRSALPTLTSEATLRKILDIVDEVGEPASGLVFELEHDNLGRLNENGVTGLAMLARRGIAMALVNVTSPGLDLASLRHLGVKYIGIDADSVESGYGVSPTWQEFVQVARGLQFQVMLLDVATSQQAASASQVARFAAGPFFAPPRRVKGTAIGGEAGRLQRRRMSGLRPLTQRFRRSIRSGSAMCGASSTTGMMCLRWPAKRSGAAPASAAAFRCCSPIRHARAWVSHGSCASSGVPDGSYSAIVTSGDVTQELLRQHARGKVYPSGTDARHVDLRRPESGARAA